MEHTPVVWGGASEQATSTVETEVRGVPNEVFALGFASAVLLIDCTGVPLGVGPAAAAGAAPASWGPGFGVTGAVLRLSNMMPS